jgi:hypothetical protein
MMRRGSALLMALSLCVVPLSRTHQNSMQNIARHHREHDGDHHKKKEDRSTGKNSRGKCEKADYCDDRDFSPTFDKSPVQDSFNVCLPGATCNYGDDKGKRDSAPEPAPSDSEQALPSNLDPRCFPFHCDPKPEALFPPDPKKLTELIQAFTSGVGKSAGDLAGAIAAFPPALLL